MVKHYSTRNKIIRFKIWQSTRSTQMTTEITDMANQMIFVCLYTTYIYSICLCAVYLFILYDLLLYTYVSMDTGFVTWQNACVSNGHQWTDGIQINRKNIDREKKKPIKTNTQIKYNKIKLNKWTQEIKTLHASRI